jgi:hypothetical protein
MTPTASYTVGGHQRMYFWICSNSPPVSASSIEQDQCPTACLFPRRPKIGGSAGNRTLLCESNVFPLALQTRLVAMVGVEPTRDCSQRLLRTPRLPVTPHGRDTPSNPLGPQSYLGSYPLAALRN